MERKQINSAANKLATTVGDVSFTKEEIVVQSDIERIGSDIDMLVVEIDQQKYEEYLSSESGKLNETRHYRRVRSNTRATGKKVSTDEWGSLQTAVIESLFGQKILAENGLSTAEKTMGTRLTRTQLRNRNRRAKRKGLEARIERKANFIEPEAMIP